MLSVIKFYTIFWYKLNHNTTYPPESKHSINKCGIERKKHGARGRTVLQTKNRRASQETLASLIGGKAGDQECECSFEFGE